MVGLVPLFAVETLDPGTAPQGFPVSAAAWNGFLLTGPILPGWYRIGLCPVKASADCSRCSADIA